MLSGLLAGALLFVALAVLRAAVALTRLPAYQALGFCLLLGLTAGLLVVRGRP